MQAILTVAARVASTQQSPSRAHGSGLLYGGSGRGLVSAMPLTDCPHPLGGIIRVKERDFPSSPLVKAPLQGEQFRSLVREL